VAAQPFLPATFYRRNCGQVKAAIYTFEGTPHSFLLGDIRDQQLDTGMQILGLPAGKVIENANEMTFSYQGVHEMRPDEAGATSYQISGHVALPRETVSLLSGRHPNPRMGFINVV
jgi:hypothetical protein